MVELSDSSPVSATVTGLITTPRSLEAEQNWVFKTVEGTKVPWRVRFPSASAKP